MANLPESSTFDAGVYQLETTDPVVGGPSGVSNAPLKNLANRTKYLKDQVDSLESTKAPLASPALTGTPTAPTAAGGTSTTQLATTAFVQSAVAAAAPDLSPYAPKASPVFTGNPVAPTPAQFDNDTSLATTAFVRRALGSNADVNSFSANATLTAAHVGQLLVASASGGFTLTLPSASAVQAGGAIEIFNGSGSAIAVQRAGADTIWVDTNGYNKASMTVGSGDTLRVISNGASGWILADCSVAATYSALFSASLGLNGYQKLPSGMLIQWGFTYFNSSGWANVTFPVAFTSTPMVSASVSRGSVLAGYLMSTQLGPLSTTGVQIFGNFTTGGSVLSLTGNEGAMWVALGK